MREASGFRLQTENGNPLDRASPSTGFIPVEATIGSYQLPPPSLSLSTGFIPVGATTGSYQLPTIPAAFHRVHPGGSNN
jgi:hypothetical protein